MELLERIRIVRKDKFYKGLKILEMVGNFKRGWRFDKGLEISQITGNFRMDLKFLNKI